ncbi:SusC/RagA family TonB-linked outer membrane protein [Aliifodinibius sp. S!AR15-10]|uniref:SusC/RagA family TonB-linked outer membrane protein n=1 Tax=Aliifodinibius sp. S!AR15-10 TaxID=2950437 RepID=UPI00285A3540|nr:SusC/RagA family TonB-linked outer membrane protein [Aliifodinibius sp. S!AR15-10]MDR8394410.1 SusC/RagA family TonB-linked outer membrane protein [Aliifodinibius sp. S!AR15-10]
MLRKLLFLVICFFTFSASGIAQVTLEGTVTDAQSGEAMPGVNVLIQELQRGTATNANGEFSISGVESGTYTLVATFIGYQRYTTQIQVGSEDITQNISLQPDVMGLEEVVVTALGIERETRAIGYSVQEVDGEAVARSQESNLVNALAGKVAGVQINSSSGQPGSSSRITIRGNSSMLGNNQPLFIVDGIPISNESDDNPAGASVFTGGTSNRALDIDPSIIEDVSVLKGASATALYGSRAANGVVIITTKSGEQGLAPRITFNSSVGWDKAIVDGFNDEYLGGADGLYANGLPPGMGGYAEPGYSETGNTFTISSWGPHKDSVSTQVLDDLGVDQIPTYNPREQFYETGIQTNNSISISGGTSGSSYFFSANNTDQSGIVPGAELQRTSLIGKFSSELSDKLNVQTSINYIKTENSWLSEGNGTQNFLFGLNFTPISYNLSPSEFEDGTQRMHHPALNNPFWLADNNGFNSDLDRYIATTSVSYDILPWLTISEKIGIDNYTDTRKGKTNVNTRGSTSSMYDQKITRTQVNSDLTITANRDLTEDISVDLLVGNNINSRYYNYDYLEGTNLNIPNFFHISNANVVTGDEVVERTRLYSAYGQATISYREDIYLTLTGRNDWSSTLPDDNNSYFYPSASLGFVFSDAFDLFEDTFLSFGKLRASASQIGNDAPVYSLSTNFVQAAPGDGVRGDINYPFNGVNGYQLQEDLGNPELKPEITTEYEIGTDLRFFESRVRFDFSYYDRTTKNQIFEVPVSNASGFDSRLSNAGEIRNYGVEFALGLTPVQSSTFQWDLNVNFAKNTTDVVQLAPGVENIFLGGFTSPQIRIEPDKNGYGVIWSNRYERFEEGEMEGVPAGALKINDEGLPIQAGGDGAIGNVQPDWTGNLRSTFSYKGIQLSAVLDRRHGGDIMNMDLFYTTFYGTAEITEKRGSTYTYDGYNVNSGERNDVEITRDEDYWRNFYSSTFENFVEDGSFWKLRELSLAYTLPQSVVSNIPIQSLTIKGTGRNLWIQSDFSYRDPEGSLLGSGNAQGFYHMVTPGTRSYSVSLQVTF